MRYYLNIGTNLGDRWLNLRQAIAALSARAALIGVSPVIESEPWGFDSSHRFLNVGVSIDTDLQPLDLLDQIQELERQLGSQSHRDADGHYVDRLVDIDIMAIDTATGASMTIDHPRLQVPHRHLHERDFFVRPYQFLLEHTRRHKALPLHEVIYWSLPFEPNDEQVQLIARLAHFAAAADERMVFLLKGYAGTGKTSVVGALISTLTHAGHKCVLLAPTGRAAHIMSEHARYSAWTIHRKIYRQQSYGTEAFGLAENRHTDTLFVVDEASMIANGTGDAAMFGTGQLLDDLITYVYSGNGCRLLLVGDNAQLPPVGTIESPALDSRVLAAYGLQVTEVTLRQTARQGAASGILHNATLLRQSMECDTLSAPMLQLDGFSDITTVMGDMLLETISDCYDRDTPAQTLIITRSNRRATLFNQAVRNQILFREDELSGGDLLLVAKNNYFWGEAYEQIDFIANGDVAIVRRVRGEVEQRYGLRFATVVVELPDHDGTEMEAKVVLDCLYSDTPALTRQQHERLFAEVMAELPGDQRSRLRALKQHPYYNALQVKMAYAVTCHKAQGGQWRNVLIDMGGIATEAMSTLDYQRWLYTAMTRASQRVYLINYVQLGRAD